MEGRARLLVVDDAPSVRAMRREYLEDHGFVVAEAAGGARVFKLVNAAAKTWRRLNGENQLPKLVQGVKFANGIEIPEMSAHHAA